MTIDPTPITQLVAAIHEKRDEAAKTMVKENSGLLMEKDRYGATPLLSAFFAGNKEMIFFLLERGADVHARNSEGHTPLHLLTHTRLQPCLKAEDTNKIGEILLSKGADIHAKTLQSLTPLHMAVLNRGLPAVSFLMSRGADPHLADNNRNTPLSIAQKRNDRAIIKVILDEMERRKEEQTTVDQAVAAQKRHADTRARLDQILNRRKGHRS